MPLFKFFRPEIWRWNLWSDGPKRLKYRVRHFWPKMLWYEMLKMIWLGRETTTGYPNSLKKKGSDSTWG